MNTSFTPCHDERAKRFVRDFWQTEGTPLYQSETILPKGTVEFIFSFNDSVPFCRDKQGPRWSTPRCFLSGVSNIPIQLQAPKHQAFFGVNLYPAAVKKLLNVPCGEFLNAITDLETISKEFSHLWHLLVAAGSFSGRVSAFQQWLLNRLTPIYQQEMAISDFLRSHPEPVSVAGLAQQFCYSTRQLNRKTQELFGMSTEMLIGYKRYVHALQLMHHSNETLTRIGYHCHFYDQAHFNREFRDYTGLTPGEYRQQKSSLAGHLFQ
jgi:AraC-like DNA-binding protein